MFFFSLRGNLQLFPGLFPWNLQLSSLGFSWNSSNEAYIPTFAHYIPTIFPLHPHKPIIFLPPKKRFPGGRAFGSFGTDVSRASRVALEGSRCMDGSVANMYVAKGYAEGSRNRSTFPKAFSEIHQWGIRIFVGKPMPFWPPMTGNGRHSTYKNGDDWGMAYYCLTNTKLNFSGIEMGLEIWIGFPGFGRWTWMN